MPSAGFPISDSLIIILELYEPLERSRGFFIGMWRGSVAQLPDKEKVIGSNPILPTHSGVVWSGSSSVS